MKPVTSLLASVKEHLVTLAKGNVVVANKISVGDRHVIPLCSVRFGFGAGGGSGEGEIHKMDEGSGQGMGAGAGVGLKVSPQAVIVVEGDQVRLENLVE